MAWNGAVALLYLFLLISDGLCWSRIIHRLWRRKNIVTFHKETATDAIHDHFMQLALEQAAKAATLNEVPIGAIIVQSVPSVNNGDDAHMFQVLSARHNRVEVQYDASAHAELLAMRAAAAHIQNWRLINSTLYSTLEPCPMCLAAAQAFRVDRIVYGAPDHRLGAVCTHMNLLEAAHHPFHNISTVVSGVCEQECGDIMRDFFRKRRKRGAKSGTKRWGFSSNTNQWLRRQRN
jgi:tRNA(adenine34) deaminase